MLELGIAALVIAILCRIAAGLARFAFVILLLAGAALVAIGLLGVEAGPLISRLTGALQELSL